MSTQTKELLIAAAVKLFSAQGYKETSLQEIAAAAGLTKGALYHHFRSKEDVLRRVHDDMIEEVMAASRPVLEAGTGPSETLRELIRVHLHAIETRGDAITVFLRERRGFGPENWGEIKAERDQIEAMFVDIISEGQRRGEFATRDDPRILAFGILGMICWATEWFRPGKMPAARVADTFANLVLAGLVAGTTPTPAPPRTRARRRKATTS